MSDLQEFLEDYLSIPEVEFKTYDQVASELGISRGALSTRLTWARRLGLPGAPPARQPGPKSTLTEDIDFLLDMGEFARDDYRGIANRLGVALHTVRCNLKGRR